MVSRITATRPPLGADDVSTRGHDCLVWIWSTPRVAGNHAKQIRRAVYSCERKEADDD